jgi:glucose-1-phosphate adenylyltransferase
MKVRAIILAGGEGSRLGVLTAKRTKPAVAFAGKYRIIDFTLSNCVNSGIYDVMLIAQYRPHSLIEHIGAGGPWDLNRDFSGGVRILTPYKARRSSDWFLGTADAVQQNYSFVKRNNPDMILILSGDHIYAMDYEPLITFHLDHRADLTMATIKVPTEEASRFGILEVNQDYQVVRFDEKPKVPLSNIANMGVYLFNIEALDKVLWEDHIDTNSSHDFGKDVIPKMLAQNYKIFGYPYSGYWVDVGTIDSYWKAHMDLLMTPPSIDLSNRDWVIHTRTEERPPVFLSKDPSIENSMISDGCRIESGAEVVNCVLSPGVIVESDAKLVNSIILTDTCIGKNAQIYNSIIDKRVIVGAGAVIGSLSSDPNPEITMVGKSSIIPDNYYIEGGASIDTDVKAQDYAISTVKQGEFIKSRKLTNEF